MKELPIYEDMVFETFKKFEKDLDDFFVEWNNKTNKNLEIKVSQKFPSFVESAKISKHSIDYTIETFFKGVKTTTTFITFFGTGKVRVSIELEKDDKSFGEKRTVLFSKDSLTLYLDELESIFKKKVFVKPFLLYVENIFNN